MKGRVLIIAGSDSGGGAGIQADIKAVTALGGMAMTAITALTAQNSLGVHGVHEVPVDFLRQQIAVVLDDLGADAIKTGMLHSVPLIEAVSAEIKARAGAGVPVVVDPVMRAKGGAPLLLPEAEQAFVELMLPLATVLTPNIPEARALSGLEAASLDSHRAVAAKLQQAGARAVLMKGGHLEGPQLVDRLFEAGAKVTQIRSGRKRQDTMHTHGTGCTLASATACGLAQGMDLVRAVERAVDYVDGAISRAPGYGGGHGPIDHGWTMDPKWA